MNGYDVLFSLYENFVFLKVVPLLFIIKLDNHIHMSTLVFRVFERTRILMFKVVILVIALSLGISTVMFFIEREAQPEKFGSVLRSLYYTFVTLSTIGYGDVTPVTPYGKLVACVAALCALSVFPIIGSNFLSELTRADLKADQQQKQQDNKQQQQSLRQAEEELNDQNMNGNTTSSGENASPCMHCPHCRKAIFFSK